MNGARPYLDAYNNVPHVGHAHPRIQAVAADQLKRMNSNTRYLHPAQVAFAEKVLSKLPEPFRGLFLRQLRHRGERAGPAAGPRPYRRQGHGDARPRLPRQHHWCDRASPPTNSTSPKERRQAHRTGWNWSRSRTTIAEGSNATMLNRAQKFADVVDPAIERRTEGQGTRAWPGLSPKPSPRSAGRSSRPRGTCRRSMRRSGLPEASVSLMRCRQVLGGSATITSASNTRAQLPDIVVMGKPIGNGHPLGCSCHHPRHCRQFRQRGRSSFPPSAALPCPAASVRRFWTSLTTKGCRTERQGIQGEQADGGPESSWRQKHACVGDVRGMGLFLGLELIHTDGS